MPDARELAERIPALPGGSHALAAIQGGAEHVYLVGGAVRDLALGATPADLDLVVDGDAGPLAGRLAVGEGPIRAHGRFGTATVQGPGGVRYDLASTRAESYPLEHGKSRPNPRWSPAPVNFMRSSASGMITKRFSPVAIRSGIRNGAITLPRRDMPALARSAVAIPTPLIRSVPNCGSRMNTAPTKGIERMPEERICRRFRRTNPIDQPRCINCGQRAQGAMLVTEKPAATTSWWSASAEARNGAIPAPPRHRPERAEQARLDQERRQSERERRLQAAKEHDERVRSERRGAKALEETGVSRLYFETDGRRQAGGRGTENRPPGQIRNASDRVSPLRHGA